MNQFSYRQNGQASEFGDITLRDFGSAAVPTESVH